MPDDRPMSAMGTNAADVIARSIGGVDRHDTAACIVEDLEAAGFRISRQPISRAMIDAAFDELGQHLPKHYGEGWRRQMAERVLRAAFGINGG